MELNVTYGKSLFKSAVAVGAGLVIGTHVGDLVSTVLDSIGQGFIEIRAEKGSKTAQNICERYNFKYEKPYKDVSNKVIGFHCE